MKLSDILLRADLGLLANGEHPDSADAVVAERMINSLGLKRTYSVGLVSGVILDGTACFGEIRNRFQALLSACRVLWWLLGDVDITIARQRLGQYDKIFGTQFGNTLDTLLESKAN